MSSKASSAPVSHVCTDMVESCVLVFSESPSNIKHGSWNRSSPELADFSILATFS